ncbi:hypothetical protein GCM10023156_00250 [Novipirellula rosea]|uniref:Uncharacterized protein n=1 Tax=Novipirellula rosea TaxID=1031540 RepID=A0ABP8M5M4_9BACT
MDDGVSTAVLLVHRDALIIDESGTYVSRVFDSGETSFVVEIPVKAGGVILGEWVQIVPLLRAGDQVVIRADERLDSGREVDITKIVGGHPSLSKEH